MKRKLQIFITTIMIFILGLSSSIGIFAQEPIVNQSAQKEMDQIFSEINAYMQQHNEPLEIEAQVKTYYIPLSNGEEVILTQKMKRTPMQPFTDYFDAKLGSWYYTTTLNLIDKGQISVRTTVNVTHVANMNVAQDTVTFSAYDGIVDAIPERLTSIAGKSASTSAYQTEWYYKTTGYVSFAIDGLPNYNAYFTQHISGVDNHTANRNKIQISLVLD